MQISRQTYDWAKRFEKEGIAMISEGDVHILRNLKIKFIDDYYEFFQDVGVMAESSKSNKRMKGHVDEVLKDLEATSKIIDKMLGEGGTPTQEDLQELFGNIHKIEGAYKFFASRAAESAEFSKILAQTQELTGTDFTRMSKTHQIVKGRMASLGKDRRSFLKKFEEAHPEQYALGAKAFDVLGTLGLGPFASVGKMVGGFGASVVKDIMKKRQESQMRAAASELTPKSKVTSTEFKQTYEDLRDTGEPVGKHATRYGTYGFGKEKGTAGEKARSAESSGLGRGKSTFIGGAAARATAGSTAVTAGIISAGLVDFFSRPAFAAPYTKELLEAIEGVKKGSGGGGGLGGLASAAAGGLAAKAGGALASLGAIMMSGPVKALLAGLAMSAWDAFQAVKKGQKEDWLDNKGKPYTAGQKAMLATGGVLGGTDKGLGEKGSTAAGVTKQSAWGGIKGALIGGGLMGLGAILAPLTGGVSLGAVAASLPLILGASAAGIAGGAAVGGGIGALTHLLGGRKIASGLQGLTRIFSGDKKSVGKEGEMVIPQAGRPLPKMLVSSDAAAIVSSNDKLSGEIRKMGEKLEASQKDKGGITTVSLGASQSDNYGINDPLLDSLNNGSLEVE